MVIAYSAVLREPLHGATALCFMQDFKLAFIHVQSLKLLLACLIALCG